MRRPRYNPALPGSLGAYTPGDGVAQQRGERVGLPRASKREGRRVRGVDGPGCPDRGVVAVAEREVRDAALAHLTGVAEHAGFAVGLQRRVRGVEGADGGRRGVTAVVRG